jgi:dienelactone hydrolase
MTFTHREMLAEPPALNRPQTPVEPFPYRAEDVAFDNPAFADVHLAGTLTLPESEGPFPAAIMITGSGGQDRNEEMLGHKPFAVIADHLTRHGVAVLRFDDRGVGKSTGNYAAATSADLATDANAAFAYLATRPEIRHDAIGMIGHSEGGMIGPIAMAANDKVAYFISLAGPGTNLDQLMLSQRRLLTTQMGLSQAEIDRQEPIMAALFKAVRDADTPEAGFEAAMAVMTPEAKTALGMTPEMDGALVVRQVSGPWYQYFLKYDPAPNWSRINVPVLALNGSLDLQVPAEANLAAIGAATRGNPDVTIIELPGLNHLFQTATTGSVGEYRDIEETISPAALDQMSDWLTERFVKP